MAFQTVDEYMNWLPDATAEVAKELRTLLRKELPNATEGISYGVPALKLSGKSVIYFAGWKNHVSLYPIPAGDKAFQKAIAPYVAGRGTLRFALDQPLPVSIITQVVRQCVLAQSKESSN